MIALDIKTAQNPDTDPLRLKELSEHSDWRVRYWVAFNPNTPFAALAALAKDPVNYVRKGLIRHHNASASNLAALESDLDVDIRYHVAQHPNTPIETLIRMALGDSNESVRSKALSRIDVIDLFG